MNVTMRMSPWPLAIPALGFLAYEILRFVTMTNTATALCASTVAILIVGVLRGHRVALSIWALVNLYAALMFAVALFRSASSWTTIASMYAALLAISLFNLGYSFFGPSQRSKTISESEP